MGEVETTTTETRPVEEKPVTEMKLVIIVKDGRIMMGVQSPDCDPVYQTMEGDLEVALRRVPDLVAEATGKWATAKRYPKADLPEPPPPPATMAASKPAATKPASAQPKFF